MRAMIIRACLFGAMVTLAACGDAGSNSGVASVSTTPTSNTSLASLSVNQSFANNASTQSAVFNLNSGTATTGSSATNALTISYDATAKSYTLAVAGRSQSFAASAITSQASGIAQYKVAGATATDYLTLESASITGAATNSPQYSGIGYWQRNTVSGTTQTTSFDVFSYGINTALAAVPHTGQTAFNTIVVALQTQPGAMPLLLQGAGRTDVDFLNGILTTSATTTETNLVTKAVTGGSSSIYGQAALSSSANAFAGNVTVYGSAAHSSGTFAGQFYGPSAQELGGAFATSGSDGSAVSGAIWGVADTALTPANLSLTNLVAAQQFATPAVMMTELQNSSGTRYTTINPGTGSFNVTTGGSYTVGGVASNLPSSTFSSSDKVASSTANFTSYQQSYGGGMVGLDLYKTGSANSELQLTYSSFGAWHGPQTTSYGSGSVVQYFVYGINTNSNVIAARTGSAAYTGVAYATAYNASTNTSAAVSGTASFALNFDIGGYSGSFGLKNTSTDFGTFNVSGTISSGAAAQGSITGVTAGSGQFSPTFYGPGGQEFGGPFRITVPASTTIVGSAMAKSG